MSNLSPKPIILAGERIKDITTEGLTYLNDDGEEAFIDFSACLRRWVGWQTTPEALKAFKVSNHHLTDEQVKEFYVHLDKETVVGGRDIGGYPAGRVPSISFYTEPPITFEFPSQQEWARALYAIKKVGRRTYDMT